MATADRAHVSGEEENYLRIELLLTGICPSAVRVLFDKEFNPSCLETSIKKAYNTLFDLKKKRFINTEQWKLLFPSGGNPNSTSFDVPLMITLLRNLTKLAPPTGGYDHLPLSTDTTPTADLARIKYYRNELAHNKTAKIKSAFFDTAWEDISKAVARLGGQTMKEECKELKKKRLDHSTVPWNIRGQICKIMDQWRVNDVNFVETAAAKQVLACIQDKSCVTITASSGAGKTATLQHVVLKMAAEGYDVLMITHPHDIVQFYNSNKKTLFVVDDFLGTYSINQSDLQNWNITIKRIEELIKNNLTKIIVACRLQVYRDEQFESLSIFRTNVCNLSSEDLCLSHTERKMIAEIYLEAEASDIIKYSDLFDCFPLLCKLYHDNPKLNVIDFFQNPFSVYEAEIDQLKKNKHFGKYCALALCVMFNNKLNEEVLTDEIETETRIIIDNTLEACRLDKGTSRLTLLDELDSLELTFIKKDQLKGVYKTVHDKVFDFLSYYFGKKMIMCLVKNADSLLIMQRFLLEKEEDMDQFITIVPPQYHQMYIQRMIKDWSNGYVVFLFLNENMNNRTFRQRFLCYLNTLDNLYQKQLAHKWDRYVNDTALLQCCCIGDIPLIQWCLYHCVDVDICRFDGMTPLIASSEKGNTEVVKILLANKANTNKCSNKGTSPLVIACQNNYVDIAKLLLDNKADINKFTDEGISPLHIACQNNHVEIVKLLLDKKADINKCTNDELSPLFTACMKGHVDVVKLLLDNNADINKCEIGGTSPLLIVSEKNHVGVAKQLMDNKADINKCRSDGINPLLMACNKNHVEIVKLLLDNKADLNKCTNDEVSPLYIACRANRVEIVKLLLDNNADLNKCTNLGASPLLIACCHNNIEIVRILLAKGANYRLQGKCEPLGFLSPKKIASILGYNDIFDLICEHIRQNQ